jgi:hypothetical protein
MITADIILKTYPTDYDWLPYLFRSLTKYVTGYRNLVVLLEEQYPEPPDLPPTAVVARSRRYVGSDPTKPDKIISGRGAVVERLRPFAYSDADVFVWVDSDCVFTRSVDVQTEAVINAQKPVVFWRTWDEAGSAICWKNKAELTLGYEPTRETMCCYPFQFPAPVVRAFFEFVGGADRLLSLPDFTDLNALGNYALDHHPGKVTAVHIGERHRMGGDCLRQFWSWHRAAHPDVQAELGRMGLT